MEEDEPEVDSKESEVFSYFCRKVLKLGDYGDVLTDFFLIDFRIANVNREDFNVMPHLYNFLYNGSSVPKHHVARFPKNLLQ